MSIADFVVQTVAVAGSEVADRYTCIGVEVAVHMGSGVGSVIEHVLHLLVEDLQTNFNDINSIKKEYLYLYISSWELIKHDSFFLPNG